MSETSNVEDEWITFVFALLHFCWMIPRCTNNIGLQCRDSTILQRHIKRKFAREVKVVYTKPSVGRISMTRDADVTPFEPMTIPKIDQYIAWRYVLLAIRYRYCRNGGYSYPMCNSIMMQKSQSLQPQTVRSKISPLWIIARTWRMHRIQFTTSHTETNLGTQHSVPQLYIHVILRDHHQNDKLCSPRHHDKGEIIRRMQNINRREHACKWFWVKEFFACKKMRIYGQLFWVVVN